MSAVNRDSTFYANYATNKYPVLDQSKGERARAVALPFEVTIPSPSTAADTYNLCVIPAYARVVGLDWATNGLSISAGVGCTISLGDAGSATRYLAATDMDAAAQGSTLAAAGQGYTPTSDTIVLATSAVAAPVVGQTLKGVLWVLPGA